MQTKTHIEKAINKALQSKQLSEVAKKALEKKKEIFKNDKTVNK